MLKHQRLNLGLRRFHQRAVRRTTIAGRFRVRHGGCEQFLQDYGDQIAPGERVRIDRVANEMRLHRGVDELRELTAA
ncbi:MAG TPA: hypothetical protein VFC56_16235 [Stellaceae bacterium]|nr:hypothetical protein [Stellaceae bacterium]